MACLSHTLWNSHTCSTSAKGLTKPQTHQSAFQQHRLTQMNTHTPTDRQAQCWCGTVCCRVTPEHIILNELGYDRVGRRSSQCFICFYFMNIWIKVNRRVFFFFPISENIHWHFSKSCNWVKTTACPTCRSTLQYGYAKHALQLRFRIYLKTKQATKNHTHTITHTNTHRHTHNILIRGNKTFNLV